MTLGALSEISAIWKQIQEAKRAEADPHIVHIRVTTTAIPGSLSILPLSPERARPHEMKGVTRPLEVLMHHEDYVRVLTDARARDVLGRPFETGITDILGIPVLRE